MKRLLFGIIALTMLWSCSYKTTCIGTITTYDDKGNEVKKWENITFKEEVDGYTNIDSFKSFGLNFYDPKSGKYIVLSSAMPYIIEYDVVTYKNKFTPYTKEAKE